MNSIISLRLASIAKLYQMFEQTTDEEFKRKLLNISADSLDKTRPKAGFGAWNSMEENESQISFLIRNREWLEPLPFSEWKKPRIPSVAWPLACKPKLLLIEKIAKQGFDSISDKERSALKFWLSPALYTEPELETELKPILYA